jgi:hypothetical protein
MYVDCCKSIQNCCNAGLVVTPGVLLSCKSVVASIIVTRSGNWPDDCNDEEDEDGVLLLLSPVKPPPLLLVGEPFFSISRVCCSCNI